MKKTLIAISALACAAFVMPAHADDSSSMWDGLDSPWLIRAGLAYLDVSDKIDLDVAGTPVPGAALRFHRVYTPMIEIGRPIAEDWTVVATAGFPPHIGIRGAGTIAAYGKLEDTTFGPSALTVQYQPFHGMVRPYAGVGVSYLIIFSTHDAALKNTTLSNDLAPAFELGSDFQLDETYGFFTEVKKALLDSHAGGTIAGFPIAGKADISPWVFSVGATVHL
jgi:outer membrane protein